MANEIDTIAPGIAEVSNHPAVRAMQDEGLRLSEEAHQWQSIALDAQDVIATLRKALQMAQDLNRDYSAENGKQHIQIVMLKSSNETLAAENASLRSYADQCGDSIAFINAILTPIRAVRQSLRKAFGIKPQTNWIGRHA